MSIATSSIGCELFVLLTVAAMFTYPGGTYTGELTKGYDFFRNFFSDLGRITVEGGKSNIVSAILFILALSIAGIGLIFFFIAFREFFKTDRIGRLLSLMGTIIGVASGLCFVGIACAPYDLFLDIHVSIGLLGVPHIFICRQHLCVCHLSAKRLSPSIWLGIHRLLGLSRGVSGIA